MKTRYVSPYKDLYKKKIEKPVKVKKPPMIFERMELRIDTVTDADVLDKLKSVSNKSEYIRSLIRKDIRGEEK